MFGGSIGSLYKDPEKALLVSSLNGVFIGALKEAYDVSQGSKFSGGDFAFTALGGIASGLALYGIKRRAQKYPKASPIFQLSHLTSFMAGAFEGHAETLKWHYDKFNETFSGADPNYWNPVLSSNNKYRDGISSHGPKFFGSTTFLVWTTDGYHLMRTARNASLIATVIIHRREKKKWYLYALDAATHLLAYQAGFHLTYTAMYIK